VADVLKELYAEPALVPATPWLAKAPPDKPRLDWHMANGTRSLEIKPCSANVRLLVVRTLDKGKWALRIHPSDGSRALVLPFENVPERIVVTAIDRAGCESEANSAAR
jgi:hypothetical protein